MATIYTKTALKKIKKDELVEMFLVQQAKLNDIYLAFESSSNSAMESLGEQWHLLQQNKELKEENKKLKRANELNAELHNTCEKTIGELEKDLKDSEYTRKYENSQWQKSSEKQDEKIWQLTEEIHSRMSKEQEKELKDEIENLKEKNEDLNRRLDDVNYVPFNPNYTEKAILEFIDSCPIKVVENKLNQEIENLKDEVKFWSFKHDQIKMNYERLDENYELHRKSADLYEKKLIEEIEILRKKQICDICGNAPAGY